ncbi:tripartite tricarboxylate transporter substrate binding protein [Comamonas testosteroni]|uniref:Bug family tripartite tricarboxylate transporter substrate binding protein n=1 Tax=Comamonas testosteroni TaxID=285 RepID=UPI00265F0FB9|nr:tripartite tricarboxylate transporter substrate binding protein [Comamonas testosteroni]WKL14390.1 tripartite tricarboxylate transporter substrate binding protein [Comamonas testosteroni]
MTRGIFLKISAAIALQALSIFAYADSDFPNKPVKLVVPYAPGGLPDTVARVLAEKMQADLKQPVIVENKPGGGGGVAVTAIKQYPADGHTLLMTDGPLLAVSPIIIKNLKYDAQKDLDPVSLVGVAPLLLVTNSSAPFKNMKDFIQYAKEHPGELNYGSSGIGSIHHLTAEAMAYSLGIDVRHVPFKGSSASIPALIGNQVDITFASPPTLMGFVQSGKARILATNTLARSKANPDIPAISEYAKNFDFGFTVVMLAKKGTPEAYRNRISDSVKKAVNDPEVKSKLEKAGVDSIAGGPVELAAKLASENSRVIAAAKLANLKPE